MSVTVRFWKMSGAGNDFVVLPMAPEQLPVDLSAFVRRVCARGVGVGADGVLFVTPSPRREQGTGKGTGGRPPRDAGPTSKTPDAVLIHYNADGGRSDFCGNGTRCGALRGLAGYAGPSLLLETDVGVLRAEVRGESARIEVPAPTAPFW
jgi:diaminopimelate epimerase